MDALHLIEMATIRASQDGDSPSLASLAADSPPRSKTPRRHMNWIELRSVDLCSFRSIFCDLLPRYGVVDPLYVLAAEQYRMPFLHVVDIAHLGTMVISLSRRIGAHGRRTNTVIESEAVPTGLIRVGAVDGPLGKHQRLARLYFHPFHFRLIDLVVG